MSINNQPTPTVSAPTEANTMEPLSLEDSKRLIELEKTITRGKREFIEVGAALAEIRDDRLYKADYESFEDYCVGKWGFKRSHAYRMIEAAGIATEMSPMGDIPNERTARAVAKVRKEDRASVVKTATKNAQSAGRTITSNDITMAAQTQIATSNRMDTPAAKGHFPRAKTKLKLQNWYYNAPKHKRGQFLNYIFSNGDITVVDKTAFKKQLDSWFENYVHECSPESTSSPESAKN